ncbi:hypothetical protein DRP77_09375 [Candidatus Poribacteria bacterium]|nr:MAG: hypothetical protein DRP77_09375 [Candidatus Poribacteria bacterium]
MIGLSTLIIAGLIFGPWLGDAPKLALIIDDLGRNRRAFEEITSLGIPLSLSFLPDAPFSKAEAETARSKGFDVMLHLPMEPHGYPEEDPGEMAVLCRMTDEEIAETVERALLRVPGAVGVDNHMGSKATEDPRVMRAVLSVLKRRGLFFLDALTTPKSVGYKLAREMGVPTAHNDLFIDNSRDEEAILKAIHRLSRIALRRGYAIGIGHPYPETIRAIRKAAPVVGSKGIRFAKISELVR